MVAILKEAEGPGRTGDVARRHGISQETFLEMARRFGRLQVSDAKRLRALQEEI